MVRFCKNQLLLNEQILNHHRLVGRCFPAVSFPFWCQFCLSITYWLPMKNQIPPDFGSGFFLTLLADFRLRDVNLLPWRLWGVCVFVLVVEIGSLPSLKLTAFSHLKKMDGWKTNIVSFWDPASWQVLLLLVSGRGTWIDPCQKKTSKNSETPKSIDMEVSGPEKNDSRFSHLKMDGTEWELSHIFLWHRIIHFIHGYKLKWCLKSPTREDINQLIAGSYWCSK